MVQSRGLISFLSAIFARGNPTGRSTARPPIERYLVIPVCGLRGWVDPTMGDGGSMGPQLPSPGVGGGEGPHLRMIRGLGLQGRLALCPRLG